MKRKRTIQVVEGNGFPLLAKKIMPNDLCPCKSGKKAKKCCGAKSEYFYSKLTDKQKEDLKLRKEAEEKAKKEKVHEETQI